MEDDMMKGEAWAECAVVAGVIAVGVFIGAISAAVFLRLVF